MNKCLIGIIDSGVKRNHPAFLNSNVQGYSLKVNSFGNVEKDECFEDEIGHGTAVYYLIQKDLKEVEITNIKVFFKDKDIDSTSLEFILEYILENEFYNIINISMGIVNYGNVNRLQKVCNEFHKKGTIIVSAFDNNGAVSFPAALNNVIGVDVADVELEKDQYLYLKNNIIDIVGKRSNIRVAWINPSYILVSGSSFICANVTSIIAKQIQSKGNFTLEDICIQKQTFSIPSKRKMNFKIEKAITFPFNKEIHALARYETMLDFQIVDYYTSRITGQVGKKVSDILPNAKSQSEIKNIQNINWDSFDTIILGHLGELNRLTKIDYYNLLIPTLIEKNKNIYSFDDLQQVDKNYRKYFTPLIDDKSVHIRCGKLYVTNKPILTILGTNSRQGKFTLQLYLRKGLMEKGYKVGQIGTEPSSLLFGIDEVYPSGYNSQVYLHPYQICSIVNKMIWDITQKDVDIILIGCQSGFLAYNDRNISMFPFFHQIFFESTQTDAIIVCINAFDSMEFVEKVIKVSEGLSNGKVLGLVCFPVDYVNDWKGSFGKVTRIDMEKEKRIKKDYLNKFNLNVYMLDNNDDLEALLVKCIDYF